MDAPPPPPLLKRDGRYVVVAAAILDSDKNVWSLPAPARHSDVHRHAREHDVALPSTDDNQGFLLSNGRFCRRRPALLFAEAAKQLIREPTSPRFGLFSEDVW